MADCSGTAERLSRMEKAFQDHPAGWYGNPGCAHHQDEWASSAQHLHVRDACFVPLEVVQGNQDPHLDSERNLEAHYDQEEEEDSLRSSTGVELAPWCWPVSAMYYGQSSPHIQSHREGSCYLKDGQYRANQYRRQAKRQED